MSAPARPLEVDMMPGPNADKTEWRYWAKTMRAKLPDVSERVCLHLERFLNDLGLETGRSIVVLAYRSLPDEIRLGSLVANLPELTWLTTRVQPGVSLSLHEYALATVRNRWGMLEPPEDSPGVPFSSVDVVLVPGLVFDTRGSRLGFGRGYYDRLLALLGPDVLRVGVTREALLVDRLPSDPWDVPMTHLATGAGVEEILLDRVKVSPVKVSPVKLSPTYVPAGISNGEDLIRAISSFTDQLLPRDHVIPEIDLLYKMMRDYPNRPGKMIRSRLLVASCLAHGGNPETALPLAVALELFQNWVLIHDDIEDDSDERRGKPALHRLHPVSLSINAGDALHVYMWQVVHQSGVPGAFEEFLEMIHRTAEGQHIDLGWVEAKRWDVRQADYLELVRLKTARYTVVSPFKLGALAAGCEPDSRLADAGLDLGIAFQIRDDVLNLIGDFATYGKEIAGDLLEGKRTLMLVHLLEHADPVTRAKVIGTLERARLDKTQAEIDFILEKMHEFGSISHAQTLAEAHTQRGLETLEAALAELPGHEAAQQILDTARSLASRMA